MAEATQDRRPALVALGAVVLLFLALSIHKIYAVDTWWQLATGRWIVENTAWPSVDFFSYNAAGAEWIELRWIFCVVSYALWELGGATALILVKTFVLGTSFGILCWRWRSTLSSPLAVTALALGVFAASDRFVVRPELVTFLLMAVFLAVLERQRSGNARAPAGVLAAAQVVWVNAHTLFVLGPVLAWAYLVADTAQRVLARRRSGKRDGSINQGLLVSALAVSAACLINPYGLRGALFPWMLFRQIQPGEALASAIVEFRSPFLLAWWPGFLWAAAALAILGIVSFLLTLRRLDAVRALLFLAFLYLACVSIRNVALFVFVGTWATLDNLHDLMEQRVGATEMRKRSPARAALVLILLAVSWYVASDRYTIRQGSFSYFGLGVSEERLPRAATRFLVESAPQGRLYHEMADASYLLWEARDRYPVFIDPRLEVYAGEPMSRYLSVSGRQWGGIEEWNQFADSQGIRTALLTQQYERNLIPLLRDASDWHLVHLDARNAVFVKDIPEHAELLRRFRITLDASWRPSEPIPQEVPRGWRRWIGAVGRPWYSFEMAKMLLVMGASEQAAGFLEHGLERFPDHEEMRWTLAQIYSGQGRMEDAAKLMAGVDLAPREQINADRLLADQLIHRARASLESGDAVAAAAAFQRLSELRPDDPDVLASLGLAFERAGNEAQAVDAYRRALRLDPQRYQVHNQIAILLAKRGDLSGARRHLEQALAIRPDYAAARSNLERLNAMR